MNHPLSRRSAFGWLGWGAAAAPWAADSGRHLVVMLLQLVLASCQMGGQAAEPAPYPPLNLPDTRTWGRTLQRTMRLLATSTADQPNTVRILFYGQSITEQRWTKLVAADLRRRFPHANLVMENRALGGFASQMLVKTAETDLYPFQPDLLIFHVYGAHDTYEDIIRRTRERTTAEILMQNDHVTKPEDFTEETDPAKLPPAGKHWDACEVKWKVEPRFVDEFVSPGVTHPAPETVVPLASGLPNGRHTLEISGNEATPIAAIRTYRPPGKRPASPK